jgi:tetratricopeptide (TPR) repeat protein
MNVGALGRRLGFVRGIVAVIAIVLSLLTLGSRAARAAGDDEKAARALYESAEKKFNVGKFAEALTDYQAAYEAKPLPGFLFNIAQCYRNMGNYERARFFFRRYLSIEPKAPNHRRVEELISEMTKQMEAQAGAPASPTTPPSTAAPPSTSPPPAETPAGETKPGEPAAAAPPEPKPAEPLPAAPAPHEDASSSAAAVVTATPPAPESHPVYTRWWFWTGVGAVVVGGAVAAFFLTQPKTVTPGTLQPIDGRM